MTVYCVYTDNTRHSYTGDHITSNIQGIRHLTHNSIKEVTMLQMDGVSALDCLSVSISAEHQTGNSILECKQVHGYNWYHIESMKVTVYSSVQCIAVRKNIHLHIIYTAPTLTNFNSVHVSWVHIMEQVGCTSTVRAKLIQSVL